MSLFPSATETVYELGLWSKVLGVTTFCTMPAGEVRNKPKVGGTKNPDLRRIAELKPDIVLMNSEENRKEDAAALQELGIAVHASQPSTVADSIEMIAAYGRLFGAEQKSELLCAEIRQHIESNSVPRRHRSLTLIWVESRNNSNTYRTVAPGTYVDSICNLFGFDNVVQSGQSPYPEITIAEIEELDPEVLLLPDEPFAFREKHAMDLRQELPGISAVRNNRMLLFNGMYATWHGYGTLRTLREFPAVLRKAGLW